jgi:hypothetical protein
MNFLQRFVCNAAVDDQKLRACDDGIISDENGLSVHAIVGIPEGNVWSYYRPLSGRFQIGACSIFWDFDIHHIGVFSVVSINGGCLNPKIKVGGGLTPAVREAYGEMNALSFLGRPLVIRPPTGESHARSDNSKARLVSVTPQMPTPTKKIVARAVQASAVPRYLIKALWRLGRSSDSEFVTEDWPPRPQIKAVTRSVTPGGFLSISFLLSA